MLLERGSTVPVVSDALPTGDSLAYQDKYEIEWTLPLPQLQSLCVVHLVHSPHHPPNQISVAGAGFDKV